MMILTSEAAAGYAGTTAPEHSSEKNLKELKNALARLPHPRHGQRDFLHPCRKNSNIIFSVDFEILDQIKQTETFAQGSAIREIERRRRQYGAAHWRKRKGIATVRLKDGTVRLAEIHWYEAAGIGKREFKIKYYLD